MGILYFGPAAENAFMAFEQKTNHAVEIAGNCLYLQFQRAHSGPCGCGRRFMPGFTSPAPHGTKRMEQIRASDLRAPVVSGAARRGLSQDKATMESFSPESSVEEPRGLGTLGESHLLPEIRSVEEASPPRVRPLPLRDPNPTLLIFSYSFFRIHFEGSISPVKRQCPL